MKVGSKAGFWNVFGIIFVALILRLLLATVAHHGDLNNNISWGQIALESGLNGFYGSSNADDWPYSAPNQPPLYILLFAVVTFAWSILHKVIWFLNNNIGFFPSTLVWFWEERGISFLAKTPSILADIGIGVLMYRYLKEKFEAKSARFALLIWLINPAAWYNSSIWGQTDPIVNFLGLWAITSLLKSSLVGFAALFSLSVLFKSSLLIFVPILLPLIYIKKFSKKTVAKSLLVVVLTVFAISLWFHPYLDHPLWLFNLYSQRILPGEIGYLTANAFNIWWLVDPGNTYDSQSYFGIPAQFWGLLLASASIFYIVWQLTVKKFSDKKLLFALSLSAFSAFLLLTRMHERYLYPFFVYATLFVAYSRHYLPIYILLSVSHLLNLYNLFWVPGFPFLKRTLEATSLPWILSVLNIALFGASMRFYQKDQKPSSIK